MKKGMALYEILLIFVILGMVALVVFMATTEEKEEEEMKRNILTDEELYEIKAREYERGLKDAKPVVGESFVKVYVKVIKEDPHQCTRENLIGMLREAGVEIIID